MSKRRNVAWLAAVVVGLMLVPATSAMAASKHEQAQNAAIGKASKAAAKALNRVAKLTTTVTTQGAAITALQTKVDGIDATVKGIVNTAAPQIQDALTKLGDAAQQLKAGLETAGAGLNSLKTLATSQEYGIGQVIVIEAGPSPNPQEGSFVETPDIPDTVQQAQVTQQFVAQQSGALAVAYGVRSAENDGTGADKPAALCKVTVTNEGGTTETTAPNGAIGGLPFQPVDTKSALTSTVPANAGFPFGLKTSGDDADHTTTFVSSVVVAAGDTYTVGLACVDTSPDATDPAA